MNMICCLNGVHIGVLLLDFTLHRTAPDIDGMDGVMP
jgi:hypothetical protein